MNLAPHDSRVERVHLPSLIVCKSPGGYGGNPDVVLMAGDSGWTFLLTKPFACSG